MQNAVSQFSKLQESSFYTTPEKIKKDLIAMLSKIYGPPSPSFFEEKGLLFYDEQESGDVAYVSYFLKDLDDCMIQWYDFLEANVKAIIQKEIYEQLDFNKNDKYVRYSIAEVKSILSTIRAIQPIETIAVFHEYVVSKLKEFILFLDNTYLQIEHLGSSSRSASKIKWLGQKNVLGTLFYDLWKGQTDDKGKTTKPMIAVEQKQHLIDFIIENFVDSKGNHFNEHSLSGILSDSINKTDEKASQKRIVFHTPS